MSLIYLVGPRACGKTTLGKALSEVLDVPYCDTDHHLCERLGMDVATMVERWGWEGFRSRESESLRLASEELAGRGVVATGGGMVLAEANRRYMREHGRVFFLSCPRGGAGRRLRRNPLEAQRPSLTGKSLDDEVREVLEARLPLYRGRRPPRTGRPPEHHGTVPGSADPAASLIITGSASRP